MNYDDVAKCLILKYLNDRKDQNQDISKVIDTLKDIWALKEADFSSDLSLIDLIPDQPTNNELFKHLVDEANVSLGSGNYDQSIEKFTEAIQINPNLSEIYNKRSSAHMKKHDYANAVKDLEKAVELDSHNSVALCRIVFCYWFLGNTELSQKYFKIATENGINDAELESIKMLISANNSA